MQPETQPPRPDADAAALDKACVGASGDIDKLRKSAEQSREKLLGPLYSAGWTTSVGANDNHATNTLTWAKGTLDLRLEAPEGPPTTGRETRETALQHDLRVLKHLRMFTDTEDPNHRNALKAARPPLEERPDSPQFAACELAAQETVHRTLSDAGVPFEPFDKGLTDRCRPQWKSIASEPAAAARVEESIAHGCERMTAMADREPREAPRTRGAGRPVGGAPPAAPTTEREPARS